MFWNKLSTIFAPSPRYPSELQIKQRLAETIMWCAARAEVDNPQNSLRTPELNPGGFSGWGEPILTLRQRIAVVESLAEKRKTLLHHENLPVSEPSTVPGGGRLLYYDPDTNLFDSAAEAASSGFFDGDNRPPWDTWLFYINEGRHKTKDGQGKEYVYVCSYLLAWIPHQLGDLADYGIRVNPEECIRWASDPGLLELSDYQFLRMLNEMTLLW